MEVFHAPRLYAGTTAERTAFVPAETAYGLLFYDTDELELYFWNGFSWSVSTGIIISNSPAAYDVLTTNASGIPKWDDELRLNGRILHYNYHYIDVASVYALEVEDNGVKDNVLSVDTTNGKVETRAGRITKTNRITDTDSPYTLTVYANVLFCDTDGGAITVNLPAGVEGTNYKIINCGSSANDVTIDGNGAETVRGGATLPVADGEVVNLHYNATEGWW